MQTAATPCDIFSWEVQSFLAIVKKIKFPYLLYKLKSDCYSVICDKQLGFIKCKQSNKFKVVF